METIPVKCLIVILLGSQYLYEICDGGLQSDASCYLQSNEAHQQAAYMRFLASEHSKSLLCEAEGSHGGGEGK